MNRMLLTSFLVLLQSGIVNGQHSGGHRLPPGAASSSFTHRHPGGSQSSFGTPGIPVYGSGPIMPQAGYGTGVSSATYNYGGAQFGVVRQGGRGALHLTNGYYVPALTPGYGLPQLSGMYGWNLGYQPGVVPGWNAPITPLAPAPGSLTIDPWTGQFVPWSWWYSTGTPTFGGFGSCAPVVVMGPTVVSWQVTVVPSVPSTAAYSMTDPRILNLLAPDLRMQAPVAPVPDIPDQPPAPQPDPALPLLNEFPGVAKPDHQATLTDRIHSLRRQAAGDEAFRNEDYVLARDEYLAGRNLAPQRRALWIRLAFANLALKNFPEAAAILKTGLELPDDETRGWVTSEELYGPRVAERARSHAADLWNWLSENPQSSDRLLLAGTFQKMRGFGDVADNLLQMASHEGPEAARTATVLRVAASDVGIRSVTTEVSAVKSIEETDATARPKSSTEPESVPDETPEKQAEDQILLRGRRGTP